MNNDIRLEILRRDAALVSNDEKIAVFGAGGQIGTKLRPLLEKFYPGAVIYCESGPNAVARGFTPVDITKGDEVRSFLKDKNVKVVICLAALLSAAADQFPEIALDVNLHAPVELLRIAKEVGVRKVQIMSSMASQEFDERIHDSDEVKEAKKKLQKNASNSLHAIPDGLYGLQKLALETIGNIYSLHYDLDVNLPRLAGVLNVHMPWPSNGTTEELDKLIMAAAIHHAHPQDWQSRLTQLIGENALKGGHYLQNGVYVPEVPGEACFDMVDGRTLPQAILMLLHKDLRGQHGVQVPGAVHNVSEYSVSMQEAVEILRSVSPEFPVRFATSTAEGLDRGKTTRAGIWPSSQDTKSTEALIGEFKQFTAQQSILGQFRRVVAELRREAYPTISAPGGPEAQTR